MARFENDSFGRSEMRWNVSEDYVRRPDGYVKIAYALTASIGITGNLVVICIVANSAMRKTYTNILILNQSGIDIVASVVILVTTVTGKPADNLSGITGELYCRLWLSDYPMWSLLVSSSYTLMALTFERYMSIVHPVFHHSMFSTAKVIALGGVAWCPGFVLNSFSIVPNSRVIDGHGFLEIDFLNGIPKKAVAVTLFVIQYLAPTVCFVTCYSRMFTCLRHRVAAEGQGSHNTAAVMKVRARHNVLKMLVIVVACYIACNSCNQIMFLALRFGATVDYSGGFYNFTVIAMFANCCVNPFIYTLQYERYRKELCSFFYRRTASAVTVHHAIETT